MRFYLTFLFILSAITVQAKVVKPLLDHDLSHRYDSNFEESDRSIAGDKPEPVDQVNEDENWEYADDPEEESSRNPSAAGKTFEKENENGIRYWKY